MVLTEDVFDLLWRLHADIVKLDVGSLLRADKNQRRRLQRLVEHTPIEIIATGVETAEQACTARALGIAGLQGFYFGAPKESVGPRTDPRERAHSVLEGDALRHLPPLAHQGACLQFCC